MFNSSHISYMVVSAVISSQKREMVYAIWTQEELIYTKTNRPPSNDKGRLVFIFYEVFYSFRHASDKLFRWQMRAL